MGGDNDDSGVHTPHRGPRESGGRTMPVDGGDRRDSGPRTGRRRRPQSSPRPGVGLPGRGVTVGLPAAGGGEGCRQAAALTEGLEVLDR